jgi:hypothetical protein
MIGIRHLQHCLNCNRPDRIPNTIIRRIVFETIFECGNGVIELSGFLKRPRLGKLEMASNVFVLGKSRLCLLFWKSC